MFKIKWDNVFSNLGNRWLSDNYDKSWLSSLPMIRVYSFTNDPHLVYQPHPVFFLWLIIIKKSIILSQPKRGSIKVRWIFSSE